MYQSVIIKKGHKNYMDESDIKYILGLINDAISNKDWDGIIEVCETLKEFLDKDDESIDHE